MGGDDNDLPACIHTKLVRVAKRGRFAHVVPPRVWQTPDGRIIEVLDNVLDPIPLELYQSLKEFERRTLAKEENTPNVQCEKKEDVHMEEEEEAIAPLPQPPPPTAPIKPRINSGKPQKQRTLVDMFRKPSSPPQQAHANPTLHQQRRQHNPPPYIPSQQHSQLVPDAVLLSRSYMFPTSKPMNDNSRHVIYWVRYGCLRIENNFALDQVLWMRSKMQCTVCAICFLKPTMETADDRAYRSAILALKYKLDENFHIPMHCFEADEHAGNAIGVLALLCRSELGARCVITTESYQQSATKTSVAVSRAIPCPLVAFDSDHLVPIRRWGTLATDGTFSRQDVEPAIETSSVSALPAVITNRWTLVEFSSEEEEAPSRWKEVPATLDLADWDPGLVLAHCRLGTMSALRFSANCPAYLEYRTEAIAKRFHGGVNNSNENAPPPPPPAVIDFVKQHGWLPVNNDNIVPAAILQQHLVGYLSPEI